MTDKAYRHREATRILSEPLLQSFFKDQEAECFEAFKRLPIDAKMENFQIVYHNLLAIGRLKTTLRTYIEEYETSLLQDEREQPEGV